jgi:hypothetical protein
MKSVIGEIYSYVCVSVFLGLLNREYLAVFLKYISCDINLLSSVVLSPKLQQNNCIIGATYWLATVGGTSCLQAIM